jgi:predicted O-methyltransferase YrrM
MKIWYDKQNLNLDNFLSEKFLFLPLFKDEVIYKHEDFKNNNWSNKIKEVVEYTSIDEAEYIVYHDKLDSNIEKFINSVPNHKPILAFYNDDNDSPISSDLPPNLFVLRTSINKSKQTLNEFALPAWSADFNQAYIRKKSTKPVVSFCGALTHPVRKSCINNIEVEKKIKTNFIIRSAFWGGNIHDKRLRREYIENITDSDLVLCCRGAGNFSFRLYEALSLGRIPIIVDTDKLLPCDNVIDWDKFIVTTPQTILKDILEWWNKITLKEYMELQQYSRHIYETYINPAGFTSYLAKHNKFRTHMVSSGCGLYNLLKDKKEIIGVEIGCMEGINATFLLEVLPQLKLHGIDPYGSYIDWDGSSIHSDSTSKDIMIRSTAKFGDRFKHHQKTSDLAVDDFKDNSLDFVFVDGLHTYEQTLADCRNYLPKVKPGGLICGHDYGVISDVTRAIDEFSAENMKQAKNLKSSTQAWYWVKD